MDVDFAAFPPFPALGELDVDFVEVVLIEVVLVMNVLLLVRGEREEEELVLMMAREEEVDTLMVDDVETTATLVVLAAVILGAAGGLCPSATLTYVLNLQPPPQSSVLLPVQGMLQSVFAAESPPTELPVKHWLAYSIPKNCWPLL